MVTRLLLVVGDVADRDRGRKDSGDEIGEHAGGVGLHAGDDVLVDGDRERRVGVAEAICGVPPPTSASPPVMSGRSPRLTPGRRRRMAGAVAVEPVHPAGEEGVVDESLFHDRASTQDVVSGVPPGGEHRSPGLRAKCRLRSTAVGEQNLELGGARRRHQRETVRARWRAEA